MIGLVELAIVAGAVIVAGLLAFFVGEALVNRRGKR